jgi:predicted DNA-binding transcriptional regulator AlpA
VADLLPIRPPDDETPGDEAPTAPQPPPAPAAEPPLLMPDHEAARLCGISRATWHRLKARKKVPAPVKLGGRTLYRRADVELWVRLGCPDRRELEARQAAEARRGR